MPMEMIEVQKLTNDLVPATVGVLIQDPHTLVRDCLKVIVEQLDGARVVGEARFPSEALDAAIRTRPDIAMIDLSDPDRALSVIETITTEMPATRVICLAEAAEQHIIEAALKAGATGLALKSESLDDLVRAFDHVRGGQPAIAPNAAGPLLQHYITIIKEKHDRDAAIIETLASAVDAKDRYTGSHIQRVTSLAVKLAEELEPGLGSNPQLRYGFMLHDVGKIGVPEQILLKDSPLDTSEWDVMRTHPIIGLQIIGPVGLGPEVENVVRHHHERWDGSGYPDMLAGVEIPLEARLFSVADAFDAMTSNRSYRPAIPAADAIEKIRQEAGRQFDPMAVDGFLTVASNGSS
jgi:HD-GYP domain-containing protein (c-di-GMP phosphodiesterase class II)